ncbi:hypothetical protein AJ79_03033 [Helicocarpus griseus UAMH5409]|uniref:Methyltransferase domain-containing protein n=1 Tax=Helicocarpus griseus UAMH5409 TaxID=1447875 RepID=A0A2B7Y044_9EURO|nr:hypothetical protein AJ79_03033 [Helicocarpus griseus UAMH5409]
MATDVVARSADPLEIDDDIGSDSAYGDELSKYSSSLTSRVTDYPELHGRRYHAFREGRYLLPNDEKEADRLDIHHALILRILDKKLHLAPLGPNPQRALDLCTGTGLVIGNDLSPIQPSMVPANLKFVVDDVEDEWAYEHEPFDYIHGRFLVGAIRDWPRLMRQAFACSKPGGWVEFHDWDGQIRSDDGSLKDTHLLKLQDTVMKVFLDMGINCNPGADYKLWLKAAGFVKITTKVIKVPLNTWPKDPELKKTGALSLMQHLGGLEGIAIAPLSKIGWSADEIQVLLSKARTDIHNRKVHAYFN